MKSSLRLLQLSIAVLGVMGVVPVVVDQFSGTADCPSLGPIRACYLVLAGYLSIAISTILPRYRAQWFLLGWLPLMVLAASGTMMELLGTETCPRAGGDIPACFFSLGMLLVLATLFYIDSRRDRNEKDAVKP